MQMPQTTARGSADPVVLSSLATAVDAELATFPASNTHGCGCEPSMPVFFAIDSSSRKAPLHQFVSNLLLDVDGMPKIIDTAVDPEFVALPLSNTRGYGREPRVPTFFVTDAYSREAPLHKFVSKWMLDIGGEPDILGHRGRTCADDTSRDHPINQSNYRRIGVRSDEASSVCAHFANR